MENVKRRQKRRERRRQLRIEKHELATRIRELSEKIYERCCLSAMLWCLYDLCVLKHCRARLSGKKHKKLSLQERQQLYLWRSWGLGIRQIARRLVRAASTVSRELKRNRRARYPLGLDSYSQAKQAHDLAKERRRKSRRRIRLHNLANQIVVFEAIKNGLTPEYISARLFIEQGIRLSDEAIYRWIYEIERVLIQYLPRKGKRYQRGGKKRSRVKPPANKNKLSIEKRPQTANDRQEFGHWEVDCIVSRKSKACLLVLQERASRYFFAVKLRCCSAEEATRAIIRLLSPFGRDWVKSLTCDNGAEFWGYDAIMQELELPVYFCHPYCSSERGSVENRNGMLRWFFPKKTNFELISDQEIARVRDKLVNRPMRCLDYFTPQEVFSGNFTPLLDIAA
jgi:IS30 family transposase